MGQASNSPVTKLLIRWSEGDAGARDKLIPLVYGELRRLARQCMAGERRNHTLSSTALIHEAYLRLVDVELNVLSRAQFFALAARLMREILVDHARRRMAAKRNGSPLTLTLQEAASFPKRSDVDVIALDDALNGLARLDARQSQIVELRFFGGLSIEQTAGELGISPATVKRLWSTARVWLYQEMNGWARA